MNYELFDQGVESYTWYAIEEIARAAKGQSMLVDAKRGDETIALADHSLQSQLGKAGNENAIESFRELQSESKKSFADRVFLWPRRTGPKGDLVDDEMGRVLQVPGWSNIFTQ